MCLVRRFLKSVCFYTPCKINNCKQVGIVLIQVSGMLMIKSIRNLEVLIFRQYDEAMQLNDEVNVMVSGGGECLLLP